MGQTTQGVRRSAFARRRCDWRFAGRDGAGSRRWTRLTSMRAAGQRHDPFATRVASRGSAPGWSLCVNPTECRTIGRMSDGLRSPDSSDPGTLELVRGVGTRVVSVNEGSPFAVGGLVPDDVILRIGNVFKPTPGQVASVLRNAPWRRFLLLFVGRGASRYVTAVAREDSADGAIR